MHKLQSTFETEDIGFEETKAFRVDFDDAAAEREEFVCVGGFHVGELDGGVDILETNCDGGYAGDCIVVGCVVVRVGGGNSWLLGCNGVLIGMVSECQWRRPSNESREHEGNGAVGGCETPLRHVIEESAKIGRRLSFVLLGKERFQLLKEGSMVQLNDMTPAPSESRSQLKTFLSLR